MPQWLLYEVSNVKDGIMNNGYFSGSYLNRDYTLYDDFDQATEGMRARIKEISSTQGILFNSKGNLIGLKELCKTLKECSMYAVKPGVNYLLDDMHYDSEYSQLVISLLPGLLRDFFKGKKLDRNKIPVGIDADSVILVRSTISFMFDLIDGQLEFGNDEDDLYGCDNINAPFEIPDNVENAIFPQIDINAFNMVDPNRNYHCRITGNYVYPNEEAPFVHLELICLI